MKTTFLSYFYTALFSLAIGLLLWGLAGDNVWESIGVSMCIGLSIVTSFQLFGTLAERWMSPVIAPIPITAFGLLIGLFLAGTLIIGRPLFFLGEEWSSLMLGVFFGIFGYLIFGARERLARLRAQLAEQEAHRQVQEKQIAQTQLKLLQAQIEPHFLFNTLSNIAGMIRSKPDDAEKTLLNLTTLLRSTLRRTRENATTLGEELEIIDAYLQIQKIRMKDRLHYEIHVDADMRNTTLPPMLLQPLVENALKHGIDPLEEGGRVCVRVSRDAGGVLATVLDTGAGVDALATNTGTGLRNIRKRLETLYDGRARLDLADNSPHGVIASLYLPDTVVA